MIKVITLILLSTATAASQSLSIKGATVSITSGTLFSIKGDAFNEGVLINSGDFQVSGMWQNDGMYDAADGEFTLSSTGDQIINHNAQSFNRLSIVGGGTKFFLADLDILEELKLTDGLLVSQNDSKIFGSADLIITGGSDKSHVVGQFYNSGIGVKNFPVGSSNVYLPIMINSTADDRIGVSLIEPNSVLEFDNTLSSVFSESAWQLIFENGQSREITINLPWNDQVNFSDPVVAFSSDGIPFRSVSALSVQGVTASSNTFVASNGLIAIGDGGSRETLPALKVFNLVTPNGDGIHDFLKIENIEFYPENRVTILNRWGDQLFELSRYDNVGNFFNGVGDKTNSILSDGTYYYAIEDGAGKKYSGFFVLRN